MKLVIVAALLSLVSVLPVGSALAQSADPGKQAESAEKTFESNVSAARAKVLARLNEAAKDAAMKERAQAEIDAFTVSEMPPSLAAKEGDEYLDCKRKESRQLRDSLAKVKEAYQGRAELDKAAAISDRIAAIEDELRELEWSPWEHKVVLGEKDDAGPWHRGKDGLEMSNGGGNRGMFTVPGVTLASPSQLELRVRRTKGTGPLQLATRNALIIVDDNGASGIQMVDGKGYAENGTKQSGSVLSEKSITLTVTMRDGSIDVGSGDGKEVVSWKGDPKSLKLPPAVQAEMKGAALAVIGIGGDFVVESIRSKKLPAEKKGDAKGKPEVKSRPRAPAGRPAADAGSVLPKDSEWDCQITINGKSAPAADVKVTSASGDRRTVRVRLQNGAVYDVHLKLANGSLELTGIPEHVRAANGGTRRTFLQLRGSGGSADTDSMDFNFEATNNPPGGPQNELFRMRVSGNKR